MSVAIYCDDEDIENRISSAGVTLRADDGPPDDLGDVIEMAGVEIDFYCWARYDPVQLALSDHVKHLAADIATFFLCERRGNQPPAPIAQKYERAIEKLQRVYDGKLALPGVTPRRVSAPVMSNVKMQLTPTPHARVQRKRSTGATTSYVQRRDRHDVLEYVGDYII